MWESKAAAAAIRCSVTFTEPLLFVVYVENLASEAEPYLGHSDGGRSHILWIQGSVAEEGVYQPWQ